MGVAALCSPSIALAQAQIVPSNGIKGAGKTDVEGWAPFLGVTATLSLADSSSVVGQVDGFSTLFGLGLTGGADYARDQHLLRTSLTINEGFARTPVIDELVKTHDQRLSRAPGGPLRPFTINEQAGGFAEPVREPWLHLSVRVGLGGRHTFADGCW